MDNIQQEIDNQERPNVQRMSLEEAIHYADKYKDRKYGPQTRQRPIVERYHFYFDGLYADSVTYEKELTPQEQRDLLDYMQKKWSPR